MDLDIGGGEDGGGAPGNFWRHALLKFHKSRGSCQILTSTEKQKLSYLALLVRFCLGSQMGLEISYALVIGLDQTSGSTC